MSTEGTAKSFPVFLRSSEWLQGAAFPPRRQASFPGQVAQLEGSSCSTSGRRSRQLLHSSAHTRHMLALLDRAERALHLLLQHMALSAMTLGCMLLWKCGRRLSFPSEPVALPFIQASVVHQSSLVLRWCYASASQCFLLAYR